VEDTTVTTETKRVVPTTVLEALKLLFKEELFGVYYAGTLEVGPFAAHPEGWELVEGMFKRTEEPTKYTPEEKYWWSQLYVKHKSPTHVFYKESVDFITKYEEENGITKYEEDACSHSS
jgi:hypothetical protein